MGFLEDLQKRIKDTSEEIEEERKRDEFLEKYQRYEGDDELIDTKTYLEAMAKLRGNEEMFKIFSGLPELDALTEGFWEGNVIVVSGPTKEGKTTLCQTITINLSNEKIPCTWMPFDTPGEELIKRFNDPVEFYLPRRNAAQKTIAWIEEKVIEGIAKYDSRVIFIDHLGSLATEGKNHLNHATQLQHLMTELKRIAIDWRVIIFVNHHIRKIETGTVPVLSDLKDSGGIATEADMVIMVHRVKKREQFGLHYTNKSVVDLQAHRRSGNKGYVKLLHMGDRFVSDEPEDEEV